MPALLTLNWAALDAAPTPVTEMSHHVAHVHHHH
jgi:hypothetical protein